MAKEIKAGKKFKYQLESVLKVRGIREKKEQEKFADKKRAYLTEKEKEEMLKDKKSGEEQEIREAFKQPLSDFEKVLRRHAHLGVLKGEIESQVEKVIEASQKLEDQRENLLKSMKDKKIIEKDRENNLKSYTKAMQDLEMKFLDEIATERFLHERLEKE
ncbi:MAG: flagellar FliJ protein [Candidatus Saganbacteria bacterium]|uniref:Flagellar FliJ protein n=1 Tax=Candidatus Saganbacteria bacterium TaxID=2575572 RepID=A0A833L057_UNCSA|nr:MAG: flagellar FliJ protein [Candidatus Saganbacteria bacterium]